MTPPRIWASTRRRVFKYRRQDFFAENGLIHVIDKDTGAYSCVSVVTFLERARGFSADARRMAAKKMWADERDELTRMVQDMIVCCDQARRQGDPFDPAAVRRMAVHHRPGRIAVPNPEAAVAPRRRVIITGLSGGHPEDHPG
jgi:hypothetical protein